MHGTSHQIATPAGYVVPHALAYGAPGEDADFVTRLSPLPVRDAQISLIERLNREGDKTGSQVGTPFSSFTAPTGVGTGFPGPLAQPAPGRATFVQSLQLFSTTPIQGRFLLGGIGWPGFGAGSDQMDIAFACGPNYPAIIPVNAFVRSTDKGNLGSYIARWLDPAVSGTHYVIAGATAWTLADSLNFEARKTILCVGDSLWNGTGPSSVDTCIPWLVNAHYRQKGIDSRFVLVASVRSP
ncbi:hypothetical protein [Erythrobacter sp. SG61-1L]|uniref:hypothetical protein n=1 Tax=Erythrobacter sp. SG61-1L TaxID=1603897 RepID=UPI0012E1DEE2|nr:hypothetical protein [Erythrobacter sp. SG61-1L]